MDCQFHSTRTGRSHRPRLTAQASRIALLEVERQISATLGPASYEEMRRNLLALAEMDL